MVRLLGDASEIVTVVYVYNAKMSEFHNNLCSKESYDAHIYCTNLSII
jgi:hypothetical protein